MLLLATAVVIQSFIRPQTLLTESAEDEEFQNLCGDQKIGSLQQRNILSMNRSLSRGSSAANLYIIRGLNRLGLHI